MRALAILLVVAATAARMVSAGTVASDGDDAGSGGGGPPDGSATLVRELLQAAGAERGDCPAGLEADGTTQDAVCATTALAARALRKAIRSTLRGRDEIVPVAGAAWTSRQEYELTRFFVDRELFVLRHDPRDGGLALLPHQSCFRPESLARAGVSSVRDPGITAPEPTENPVPDYPQAARVERRSGFAMLQVVVSPEGAVTDACVLYVMPEGLGFREEALRSAALIRFRPGTRDGSPARVRVNYALSWELR